MKIKIKVNSGSHELELEEDIKDKDVFDFIKEYLKFIQENPIGYQKPNYLQEKITEQVTIDDNCPEILAKVIKVTKIERDKLKLIFDFGSLDFNNLPVPPIFKGIIIGNTRREKQRSATLLFLYLNSIISGNSSLSSKVLKKLLEDSGIDPAELSKMCIDKYSTWIKIHERTYRLLPQGEIEAKKLLNELVNNL